MKIHKESYGILRNQIIIYLIIGLMTKFSANFLFIATPIFLISSLFTLYFFRIPKRKFDKKDKLIYSPCDGKVVTIQEMEEKEYYKDKRIQISIFMSPLNVHNQRYCINGKIKYTKCIIIQTKPKSNNLITHHVFQTNF